MVAYTVSQYSERKSSKDLVSGGSSGKLTKIPMKIFFWGVSLFISYRRIYNIHRLALCSKNIPKIMPNHSVSTYTRRGDAHCHV